MCQSILVIVGLLRSLLNEVKFLCNSDEECQASQTLRSFFYSQFTGTTEFDENLRLRSFLAQVAFMFKSQAQTQMSTHFRNNSDILVKTLDKDLYANDMTNFAYHLTQGRDKSQMKTQLDQLLTHKLLGSRNLYGIFKDLGVTKFVYENKLLETLELQEETYIALMIALVLTLPGPG